ncbi:MAG: hypothetical protein JSV66_00450 [Trueperaceae bacterium]|nr:MAG: hypothetical protein JSV66_00450 [Trueperaceae bacterium]
MDGFEVNTDSALVNPDWEAFASEHNRRFGLVISYLKSRIRGKAYDNQAMKLRIGRQGFYSQSKRFPAAFFGDTVPPEVAFVSSEEAQAAVWEASALYRSGEAQSLTCVYSEVEPQDVFFGYRVATSERYEFGMMRVGLPLHLRVMIDAEESVELLGAPCGVLIYHRTSKGQHMILKASGRRQPFHGFEELVD